MTILKKCERLIYTNPFTAIVFLYLLALIFVNPTGEIAINDDWLFVRGVEAFLSGDFKVNALIDPSIILHLLFGFVWTKLVGFSFFSLRLLTIIQAVICLAGIYKIVLLLGGNKRQSLIAMLLVLINPLFFVSSLTFMTEISFLMLTIWSVYLFVLGSKRTDKALLYVFLGSVFAGASILIRQVGLVTIFAYLLTLILTTMSDKPQVKQKNSLQKLLVTLGVTIISILIWNYWPRYDLAGVTQSGISDLMSKLFLPGTFRKKLRSIFNMTFYLAYFLSPLLLVISAQFSRRLRQLILGIAFVVLIYLFRVDIFPVGNIFYIEGIYTKSNFRTNFSLFDNVPFKLFAGSLISYSWAILALKFLRNLPDFFKKAVIERRYDYVFLTFLILGFTFSNLFGNDLYDRYFLPAIVLLTIFIVSKMQLLSFELSHRRVFFAVATLIFGITLFLQKDFLGYARLRWVQAQKIQQDTGLVTQIYVDDVYTKYVYAKRENDYSGLIGTKPSGLNYKCYVQKYTLDTDSYTLLFLQGVDDFIQRFIDNPKIYQSRKHQGLPRVKNNLDILLYNQEYSSPVYNLVGKRAFVGGWCAND